MSVYGSSHRGYQDNIQEFIFRPTEPYLPPSRETTLTYNGLAPRTDPWSRTSYAPDHAWKPVTVDAEGRKRPVVYNLGRTTEASITKTETVVQQQVHSSHTKVEPLIHNGYVEHKLYESASPVHDSPHKGEVQTEGSQPKKFALLSPSYWRQPPNSTGYHGSGNTGYGDSNDKSSPNWPKPSGNTIRNGNPKSTGYHETGKTGYGDYNDKSSKDWPKPGGHTIQKGNPNSAGYYVPDNTGYEHYNDKSSNDWPKPSGKTARNGNYDENYHNQTNDSKMEPTVVTSGGWARPSRAGWAAPRDTSLSRPTNDIGTAMEFLKRASKTTPVPHSPYTMPISSGHKRDGYGETIDSREVSERYGHFPPSFQPEEKYTATIDSTEAARKYKGAAVPK